MPTRLSILTLLLWYNRTSLPQHIQHQNFMAFTKGQYKLDVMGQTHLNRQCRHRPDSTKRRSIRSAYFPPFSLWLYVRSPNVQLERSMTEISFGSKMGFLTFQYKFEGKIICKLSLLPFLSKAILTVYQYQR